MSDSNQPLREVVNRSGFPFQIRVLHEIAAGDGQHQWRVLASEYAWRHPETKKEHFADLVLGNGRQLLVVECKRFASGAAHVFLAPGGVRETTTAWCFWRVYDPTHRDVTGWDRFTAGPPSVASAYCAMPKKREQLEKLAGDLVVAVEQIAGHLEVPYGIEHGDAILATAMIVTNAPIHVCAYAHDEVSLAAGELTGGTFDTVPSVRFTKALGGSAHRGSRTDDLAKIHDANQRTVLVVNAEYLISTLGSMGIHWWNGMKPNRMPWPA